MAREREIWQLDIYDSEGVGIARLHFKTKKKAEEWAAELKNDFTIRKLEGLEKIAALRFYGKK